MKCLLCGQTMKTVLTFSSLLLLKSDASCLCLDCDSTFERIVKIVNFGVKKKLRSLIELFSLTIKL